MKYLIVIAALLIASCGGGTETPTSPDETLTDKDFGALSLGVTCDYLEGFPTLPPMINLVYTDVYFDEFYNSLTLTDTTTMVATTPDGTPLFDEAVNSDGNAYFTLEGLTCFGGVSLDLATGFWNLWADCVFDGETCQIKYNGN